MHRPYHNVVSQKLEHFNVHRPYHNAASQKLEYFNVHRPCHIVTIRMDFWTRVHIPLLHPHQLSVLSNPQAWGCRAFCSMLTSISNPFSIYISEVMTKLSPYELYCLISVTVTSYVINFRQSRFLFSGFSLWSSSNVLTWLQIRRNSRSLQDT